MISFSWKENSKTVGIYEGKDLKVFVHCTTDIIIDHSFEIRSNGQWWLYCLSYNGNVYMVEKDHVDQYVRKASRSSHGCKQIEIFSDLLGKGDMDNEIQLNLSSSPAYVLNNDDIILRKTEDPVRLCVSSKYIVIVTSNAIEYTVYLYEKSITGTYTNERIAKLPKKLRSENIDHAELVLIKLVTCLSMDDSDTKCTHGLRIDTMLFKQLFGENTVLLNSPVILFAHHDGSVYFIRMSSFVPSCNLKSVSITWENSGCRDTWELFCQMSSSVREIAVVTLEGDRHESSFTSLCVCGHDGQITIFLCENRNPEFSVSEVYINSPVLSVCSFHNRLYYASGERLFESYIEVPTRNNESPKKKLLISDTKVLSARNVTEIHNASANGYVDSPESPCCLHCSFLNGEMKVVETSSWTAFDSDSHMSKKDTLKDILISVEDVDGRRQEVNNQSKTQENTLRQLGIASYIMACYECVKRERLEFDGLQTAERNGSENELAMSGNLPMCVVFKAKRSRNDECELTDICVEVTNQMTVALSSNWTFTASAKTAINSNYSVSTKVKVNRNLKQNEKIILTLPVPFNEILTGCKLLIKATLMADYVVPNSHSEIENANTVCISCPLFEGEIDILDCLLPSSKTTISNENISQCTSKLCSKIKKQANDRRPKLNIQTVTTGIENVAVHARNVLHFSKSISGAKNTTNEAERVVLRTLLGKTLSDTNEFKPDDCHLMTLHGHSICLNVLPVKMDGASEDRDGKSLNETVEVIVRSKLKFAAAVHKAIRRRELNIIQVLGNRAMPEIRIRCAQEAIQTAQETLIQVSSHQLDEAMVTSAFQKLRNIQL